LHLPCCEPFSISLSNLILASRIAQFPEETSSRNLIKD
jgi:hypothetical protein